jgi:hypothetical protein
MTCLVATSLILAPGIKVYGPYGSCNHLRCPERLFAPQVLKGTESFSHICKNIKVSSTSALLDGNYEWRFMFQESFACWRFLSFLTYRGKKLFSIYGFLNPWHLLIFHFPCKFDCTIRFEKICTQSIMYYVRYSYSLVPGCLTLSMVVIIHSMTSLFQIVVSGESLQHQDFCESRDVGMGYKSIPSLPMSVGWESWNHLR